MTSRSDLSTKVPVDGNVRRSPLLARVTLPADRERQYSGSNLFTARHATLNPGNSVFAKYR
jgi:hypothetical protein